MVVDTINKGFNGSGPLISNTTAGLSYRVPTKYQSVETVAAENKIGLVVKLLRTDPISQISIRIDSNMMLEAGITQTKLGDYLDQNVSELYRQYPSYKQLSVGPTKLLGQPATEFVFTYQGMDKTTRMKMDVIGLVLKGKPYFFEFQAPEVEYAKRLVDWKNFQRNLVAL